MIDSDIRNSYLFNATIPGIEYTDTLLLIGCNRRMEVPLINTRVRKAYLNGLDVFMIGNDCTVNYEKEMLGNSLSDYCAVLSEAQNPLLIFGMIKN